MPCSQGGAGVVADIPQATPIPTVSPRIFPFFFFPSFLIAFGQLSGSNEAGTMKHPKQQPFVSLYSS
jgi:hypothetical protein